MLPVLAHESAILDRLVGTRRLVLTAPTGSGKSTQVPQMLLRHGQGGGQILVLQPRRLAARLVARRVAEETGTPLGGLVGYQTRFDSRCDPTARVRFMTEGVFLRLVQEDPLLGAVGAVVLDEFHERSLGTDLALGIVRRLQEGPRPDLMAVVMSATLDPGAVSAFLVCPIVEVVGRSHPVDIRYQEGPVSLAVWDRAARALTALLTSGQAGDVLIFMPGAYEIRRTIEACRRALSGLPEPVALHPLYSSLPGPQQDAALQPGPVRRVVVATNVAETSITIEGVHHVIDSGLARVLRHDPRRGIDVLLAESISQAASDQRAGRAGRTAPGTCTRLWSASEQHSRPAHTSPEIERIDLADAVLQLAAAGIEEPMRFPWLQPPSEQAVERAQRLLVDLGALDAQLRITGLGRCMAPLPVHPRLARMLVEASGRGCLRRAVVWAALLSEQTQPQPSDRPAPPPEAEPWASDLVRLEHLISGGHPQPGSAGSGAGTGPHLGRIHQAARGLANACRRVGLRQGGPERTEDLSKCLLVGFFDRVARRRDQGGLHYAMAGQRRVLLDRQSAAVDAGMLVAAEVRELEGKRGEGVRTVLSLASQIDPAWLAEVLPGRIRVDIEVSWNPQQRAVEQRWVRSLDGLAYEQGQAEDPDPVLAAPLLVERVRRGELLLEQWEHGVEQWLARVRCVGEWFPERGLIAYSEEDLELVLHEILAHATRYSQIRSRPCLPAVRNALSAEDRAFVERMAPAQIPIPGGRRLKLEYQSGQPPRGRARIQELYGLTESPCVASGRQRVLLEILGPNHRPVQVTEDLSAFWQRTYPELRRQLQRRYPRHEWR